MSILHRKEVIDKILDCDAYDNVKLIKGIRGAGKTTLLKSMIEELKDRGVNPDNVFYFSLLSCSIRNKDFFEVYNEFQKKFEGIDGKIHLFFDEVEYFDEWQSLLNAYRLKEDFEVYAAVNYSGFHTMPGRNVLAGRTLHFELYPFSFKEFVEYERINDSKKTVMELFREYVRIGGMPDIVNDETGNGEQIIENIKNAVEYHDLVKNTNLEWFLAGDFLRYMILTFTEEFSKKRINSDLYDMFDDASLSQLKYYLKSSGFMYASPVSYDRFRLNREETYYLADHVFFNQMIGFYTNEMYKILKNIIYIELLRRGYRVFFSNRHEKYVDFIADDYNKRIYIQFVHAFKNQSIIEKEIDFLNYHAGDSDKYIITTGKHDFSKYDVKHLNLIDFLLGDEI